jgi:hypothetical protein
MSIMSILTTYSTREVNLKIVILLLSWYIIIGAPLGVLVLVAPNGMVVGVIPAWSWIVIILVSSFMLMSWIGCIQLFKCMNLLNGKWMNKVDVVMWLFRWRINWLGRTRKWKIWIVLWIGSIWNIGSRGTSTTSRVISRGWGWTRTGLRDWIRHGYRWGCPQ